MKKEREMTSYEMRNLIMNALAKNSFGYRSVEKSECTLDQDCCNNRQEKLVECNVLELDSIDKSKVHVKKLNWDIARLRVITERLAIEDGLIEKVIDLPEDGYYLQLRPLYGSTTNFTNDELELFWEEVYFLLLQNVISPGSFENYTTGLPYFHVTNYGIECLKVLDILPYDHDRYLNKIKSINPKDNWTHFYIKQSLTCYNAGALEAAMVMLGLAGEYSTEKLIEAIQLFLEKNEPSQLDKFNQSINNAKVISKKAEICEKTMEKLAGMRKGNGKLIYPELKQLQSRMDNYARKVYATSLRLIRNHNAHPSKTKMERIKCLSMMLGYIDYYETQHDFLEFFNKTLHNNSD